MSLELVTEGRADARPDNNFCLGIEGFCFSDLFEPARLADLSDRFDQDVEQADPGLFREWAGYRADPDAPRDPRQVSDLLVRMAGHMSPFIARLFGLEEARGKAAEAVHRQDPIFRFRVDFLRRRVLPVVRAESIDEATRRGDDEAVSAWVGPASDRELAICSAVCTLLDFQTALKEVSTGAPSPEIGGLMEIRARTLRAAVASSVLREVAKASAGSGAGLVEGLLELFARWTAVRACPGPRQGEVRRWVSFHLPGNVDFHHLVRTERPRLRDLPQLREGPEEHRRRRDGFRLTDPRMSPREVLSEVHYCIYCHERSKDSCSKGMRDKQGALKKNPLGIELTGCPLDEKISEAHLLEKRGDPLAALGMIMVDNPMCPGTGHRICNDCMKGCIFQAQDPVNIPQIETAVLMDVLELPYGVEIYGLLTRWNPLNVHRPYALPYNGKNVLVVGMGPAGYTLAHHLLNEGFGVGGVDGLKIEPLPEDLVGGEDRLPRPILDFSEIRRELDDRVLAGFGGVAEYGITVRWDKNFLTLIHLTLARRRTLRLHGGVRFGGTLDSEDAWKLGFHHIAIAAGAGRPTIIGMKNNLLRGVRQASDFLMALQLTGAFKRDSLANLQVRLPAVVIGGGLTAIDSATETAAYYPVQVEKILDRHEALAAEIGEETVLSRLDAEECAILDEFLAHGRAVRAERARASAAGEEPDLPGLVRSWGGVVLAYRRTMEESPAYRLNHEEVIKSLEEGIHYIEGVEPIEAVPDEQGAVRAIVFRRQPSDGGEADTIELPARTLLIAAGTTPNITYEKERPGSFRMDEKGKFFQPHRVERGENGRWRLVPSPPGPEAIFTSYEKDGRLISFYGDNNPAYAGSVVKAMASAANGYHQITGLFHDEIACLDPASQASRDAAFRALTRQLDEQLGARVEAVARLTETIVEVIVRSPLAARKFHPGQFYRLQNYESDAPLVRGTRLTMEGIALTGAWVDREQGLLSLIVLEMGASSRLCSTLRPGQRVVVMGPTGAPTEIPRGERVLLAGGGLGNAVLFSIARALKEADCRVVYFAGYKKGEDLFKREEIEAACDQVVWSTDGGAPIVPARPQDFHFRGNIVQAILSYAQGELGNPLVPTREVTRIIAIGSDRMMAAVRQARRGILASFLRPDHIGIASINSPMQCMMKEVCAQCLQRHVDPETGRESFVFSCFSQDQPMDCVDFAHLSQRLRANSLQEKLADLWLGRIIASEAVASI